MPPEKCTIGQSGVFARVIKFEAFCQADTIRYFCQAKNMVWVKLLLGLIYCKFFPQQVLHTQKPYAILKRK